MSLSEENYNLQSLWITLYIIMIYHHNYTYLTKYITTIITFTIIVTEKKWPCCYVLHPSTQQGSWSASPSRSWSTATSSTADVEEVLWRWPLKSVISSSSFNCPFKIWSLVFTSAYGVAERLQNPDGHWRTWDWGGVRLRRGRRGVQVQPVKGVFFHLLIFARSTNPMFFVFFFASFIMTPFTFCSEDLKIVALKVKTQKILSFQYKGPVDMGSMGLAVSD